MSILIKNGALICLIGPRTADLRTVGDKIVQIGAELPTGDSRVIDASGKLVFPGFIDTHTHFEMNKGPPPGNGRRLGHRYPGRSGGGGTTTVLDFAEPERGASLASALETWHRRANGRASCHYGFHMTIKDWNPDIQTELKDMAAAGVASCKVYMAYDNLKRSWAGEISPRSPSQIPNGIPGVEHRPVLMYTAGVAAGRITAHQMMKLLSEQPAKLFGMYPRKGALAVGSDADITILDPACTGKITAAEQHQNVDYTPYEGFETKCQVDMVLLSKEVAVEAGQVTAPSRRGQFVHRGPSEFWR